MTDCVRVLFFASARQSAGCSEMELPCEEAGMNDETFWTRLAEGHASLKSLRASVRLARNHEFLAAGELIKPGDEIALIPPVSGG